MLLDILTLGDESKQATMRNIATAVDNLSDDYRHLTDGELRGRTDHFRAALENGATLNSLMVDAFATAREASRRVLGLYHYPVQLMGGASLYSGHIAEMATGEGKTLTSILPAYTHALAGTGGVHVVTVNDYLASRDSELMGRVHSWLGLTVGCITSDSKHDARQDAYSRDITYGTNTEFGFDYLRDNMAMTKEDQVCGGNYRYCIIDEVDSILIDEARTPLIISGPGEESTVWYEEFTRITEDVLNPDMYEVDKRKHTIALGPDAISAIEKELGIVNMYSPENSHLVRYATNAVKAKELFTRDKDYMIAPPGGDDSILIIDEFTGRSLPGRRYNEGLHQAIEAKEHVEIHPESMTLATVTYQNFFRLYDSLSGMTGTAETEVSELGRTYNVGVVKIPPNKPSQRRDNDPIVYRTRAGKYQAIINEILSRHQTGQPILVGTASVKASEEIAELLDGAGIKGYHVLNAKNNTREALMVAIAGKKNAITIATNMAGRGTDIVLGGNPEVITDALLRHRGVEPGNKLWQEKWDQEIRRQKNRTKKIAGQVRDVGGLCVICTELHDSRRIDNQLKGRAGRQGDPGTTLTFLSLEDDLLNRYSQGTVKKTRERFENVRGPIDDPAALSMMHMVQLSVEEMNSDLRRSILEYDDIKNDQRKVIYDRREYILSLDDSEIARVVSDMIERVINRLTVPILEKKLIDYQDVDTALSTLYTGFTPAADHISGSEYGKPGYMSPYLMNVAATVDAHLYYESIQSGAERERNIILSTVDRIWQEHLYILDDMQDGVGLRTMAQKDPLVEFTLESQRILGELWETVDFETVKALMDPAVSGEQTMTPW